MSLGMEMNAGYEQDALQTYFTTRGTEVINNMRVVDGAKERSLIEAHRQEREVIRHAELGESIFITMSGPTGSGKTSFGVGKAQSFIDDLELQDEIQSKGGQLDIVPVQLVMVSRAFRSLGEDAKPFGEEDIDVKSDQKQGVFSELGYSQITRFGTQELEDHRQARKDTNKVTVYIVETGSPNAVPVENSDTVNNGAPKVEGDDRFIGVITTLAQNPETRKNLFMYFLEGTGPVRKESVKRRQNFTDSYAAMKDCLDSGEEPDENTYRNFIQTFFLNDMDLMFSVQFQNESGSQQEEIIHSLDMIGLDSKTLMTLAEFFLNTMNTPEGMIESDKRFQNNMDRLQLKNEVELFELISERLGYSGEEKKDHIRIVRNPKLKNKSQHNPKGPSESSGVKAEIDLDYFGQSIVKDKYPQVIQNLQQVKEAVFYQLIQSKYPGWHFIP